MATRTVCRASNGAEAMIPATADPFTLLSNCVERLMNEYRVHKKLIVAVDFDDTVFDFHHRGSTYPAVLAALRRCTERGFHIVLFTCSAPDEYARQTAYLYAQGIAVTCINTNPVELPFGKWGKAYYNLLLDDRAGLHSALITLNEVLRLIELEEEHAQ